MKTIYCDKCSAEITDKSDLVITAYFISVKAYHDRCYSKTLKGWETVFGGNEPINGTSGKVKAILGFVLAIMLFLGSSIYSLIGFVALYLPLMRLYAWYSIERKLE
ncbi:hypothetical protein [Bacillus sp. REN16]|uniref:hypothetical protein n=1 Tax=Bacillus sp. REN16 TaxID=2887296 RepID=UPI001E49A9EA|nr:hypothetical protein [Bacillus sp. REN16]MCC3357048.1 hypothetical protein [Bacillus sp. REN16]